MPTHKQVKDTEAKLKRSLKICIKHGQRKIQRQVVCCDKRTWDSARDAFLTKLSLKLTWWDILGIPAAEG